MIDLTGVKHNPVLEELVDVLCNKTQNNDRNFFRAEVAFFLGKVASNMRAYLCTKDRGEIPINIYTLALATSGFGKGHSVNIMENDVLGKFRKRFVELTFEQKADEHLQDLAGEKARRDGTDAEEELDYFRSQFRQAGAYPYTFDSGTVPAVKQLRHKLLLAKAGAISLQIDEIGSNLIGSTDLLNLFLELFDQGMVKQKLVKNTSENQRAEEIDGKTPTNMLLFGTPHKLFDGGQTEDQFRSFLETGYSRRCFYGYGHIEKKAGNVQTAKEVYLNLISPDNSAIIDRWASHFYQLADPSMFNWRMDVPDDVAIKLLEYKIECEKYADTLSEHEEIYKAELSHRYFKALKLAGVYAFIDQSIEVTMDHLLQAIMLAEESGEAFKTIMNRKRPYERLAQYIADVGHEVTHADLLEKLPYYKSGIGARNEMMTLAIAWGSRRNIIIRKTLQDGIEYFEGESLVNTDPDNLMVTASRDFATGYGKITGLNIQKLAKFGQINGYHWCNHAFEKDHRSEENAIPGFNVVVLDIDDSVKVELVHELMKDYKFLTYTTKRHTEKNHRFRLILPTSHNLHLTKEDYTEFMHSLYNWLPFQVDTSAVDRSRKWASNHGTVHVNDGNNLLDVLPFIPKTAKYDQQMNTLNELRSMDNLERWFSQQFTPGNRNNIMLRYALTLADSGLDLQTVQKHVVEFNKKLKNGLDPEELNRTVMVTLSKKYITNP